VALIFSIYTVGNDYLSPEQGSTMGIGLFWAEKVILILGIIFILTSIVRYGKRSHDWKGVITMFYRRIPMSIEEYKWYRLGVAFIVTAIVLRIAVLTFWPSL